MNKIILSLFLALFISDAFGQDKPKFEIRTGLAGQFYLARSQNIGEVGVSYTQEGPSGYYSGSGVGVVTNILFHTKSNLSVSVFPVMRLSLLESFSVADITNQPDRWGLTFDLHSSLQIKLKSNSWLLRNGTIGAGVSLLNIGKDFSTSYTYQTSSSVNPQEFQATSLMSFGLHAFYERTFGQRVSARFMAIYTSGDWINWTPFFESTIHGNISVQYRIFKN